MLTRQAVQRPALVRETNLPLQVIADLLAKLESRGLVLVNGRFTGMPGRSNLTYTLAAGAAAALALRIDERLIEATLCDLRGTPVASEQALSEAIGEGTVAEIDQVVRLVCRRAGIERFRLGAASLRIDRSDGIDHQGLRTELAARLNCPVDLDTRRPLTASEQLERAHRHLLVSLFGDAAG
jgi:hypothetical protein